MKNCDSCPFKVDEKTCMLPIGKPINSVKSPREHYRSYFRWPCERKFKGVA